MTRLVANGLRRSARLDGDDLNQMIVRGRVWALGEPADEAARQVELCNRNLCALAGNLADAGFTPVIGTVIPTRQQLDFFVDRLAPRRSCSSSSLRASRRVAPAGGRPTRSHSASPSSSRPELE